VVALAGLRCCLNPRERLTHRPDDGGSKHLGSVGKPQTVHLRLPEDSHRLPESFVLFISKVARHEVEQN
jgi:hypothetical protein